MQDTKNLLRKVKEYKRKLKTLDINKVYNREEIEWYENQLNWTTERIRDRRRNGLKNKKQFRKAN